MAFSRGAVTRWLLPCLGVAVLAIAAVASISALGGFGRPEPRELQRQALAHPDDADLLRRAGRSLLDAGLTTEAADLLLPNWQRHPNDAGLAQEAARAALRVGQVPIAESAIAQAERLAPNDPQTRYLRASLLSAEGRDAEAIAALQRLLGQNPKHASGTLLLGELTLRNVSASQALPYLESAERLRPSGRSAVLRARALLELARVGEAETAARQAAQRDASPENRVMLAMALRQSSEPGRQEEALSLLDQALAAQPGQIPALKEKALLLQELGRPAESIKPLRKVLAAEPGYAEGYLLLSRAYRAAGKPALARRCADLFAALEPINRRLQAAGMRAQLEAGSPQSRLDAVKLALAAGNLSIARQALAVAKQHGDTGPELERIGKALSLPQGRPVSRLPADPAGDAP